MLRKISLSLSALSLNFLTSCATSPPDIPACIEITMSRGYCINTISAKEFEVNETTKLDGKSWWEARPSMIMLPASSWAKLKPVIKRSVLGSAL